MNVAEITRDSALPHRISLTDARGRANAIVQSVDHFGLEELADQARQYREGRGGFTALSLYLKLELCTPLVSFHLFQRLGPANRLGTGLQQSYGDHNRLLVRALDALQAGDIDWLVRRQAQGADLDRAQVDRAVREYAGFRWTAEDLLSLWLAAAFHDYGKLYRRRGAADALDACVLAEPILQLLLPQAQISTVRLVVLCHDYIGSVESGEVPLAWVESQFAAVPDRAKALVMAGAIQLAGASSLGDGRLTSRRLELFARCCAGTIEGPSSPMSRLAALLDGDEATLSPGIVSATVTELLTKVCLHGWHKAWPSGAGRAAQLDALERLAQAWARTDPRASHIDCGDLSDWDGTLWPDQALDGSVLLIAGQWA